MEPEEDAWKRHNRLLLEQQERERYQEAANHGISFAGAMTDGFAALIIFFKKSPLLFILISALAVGIIGWSFTGSLMLPVELILIAVVWFAISHFRKRKN